MKVLPISGTSNVCTVRIEITWQQAQALYELGPILLSALGTVLADRSTQLRVSTKAKSELAAQLDTQKAEWAALAATCEAEIRRRSNRPGDRQSIIKQLAAERGIQLALLRSILTVHRRERVARSITDRATQIQRLSDQGKPHHQIAKTVGISERQVRYSLAATKREVSK